MENRFPGDENILCTRRVRAGRRHYFIDGKHDSRGNRYLTIAESRINGATGKPERRSIFLYEEDFEKFSEALAEVMKELGHGGDTPAEEEDSRAAVESPDFDIRFDL